MVTVSLHNAIELIRSNNAPYWVLSKREGFDREYKMIAKFQGAPEGTDEMEHSINELTTKVALYNNPGIIYSIVCASTPKVADQYKFGPIYFTTSGSGPGMVNGLGNISTPQQPDFAGFGALMDKREALMMQHAQSLAELNRRETDLLLDRKNFEYEQKAWKEEKERKEKELKELHDTYTDHSKKVGNGLVMALNSISSSFLSDSKAGAALGNLANPTSQASGIAGPAQQPTEQIPATEYDKALEGYGEFVTDKFTSTEEIQALMGIAEHFAKDKSLINTYLNALNGIREENHNAG